LSRRDNHHQIAIDILILIVALFSPRLSRYRRLMAFGSLVLSMGLSTALIWHESCPLDESITGPPATLFFVFPLNRGI